MTDGASHDDTWVDNLSPASSPIDQEWVNSLTHGVATLAAIVLGSVLVVRAADQGIGSAVACFAYAASVIGTFASSTLSHVFRREPWLSTFRAWDQALIYCMISGTYTPIAFAHAPGHLRGILLAAIWIAALAGVFYKLVLRHRVDSISTVTYLLLGWLPAVPLAGHVPGPLVQAMVVGGVIYTIGVGFLLMDAKLRFMHAIWHVCVMIGATVHFLGIYRYALVGV